MVVTSEAKSAKNAHEVKTDINERSEVLKRIVK